MPISTKRIDLSGTPCTGGLDILMVEVRCKVHQQIIGWIYLFVFDLHRVEKNMSHIEDELHDNNKVNIYV